MADQKQSFVIVDESGNEHEFPGGFDPKRAAAIVKSYPKIGGTRRPDATAVSADEPGDYQSGMMAGMVRDAAAGARGYAAGILPGVGKGLQAIVQTPLNLLKSAVDTVVGVGNLAKDPVGTLKQAIVDARGMPGELVQALMDAKTLAEKDPNAFGHLMGEQVGGFATGVGAARLVPLAPRPIAAKIGSTLEQVGKHGWPLRIMAAHQLGSGNLSGVATMMIPEMLQSTGAQFSEWGRHPADIKREIDTMLQRGGNTTRAPQATQQAIRATGPDMYDVSRQNDAATAAAKAQAQGPTIPPEVKRAREIAKTEQQAWDLRAKDAREAAAAETKYHADQQAAKTKTAAAQTKFQTDTEASLNKTVGAETKRADTRNAGALSELDAAIELEKKEAAVRRKASASGQQKAEGQEFRADQQYQKTEAAAAAKTAEQAAAEAADSIDLNTMHPDVFDTDIPMRPGQMTPDEMLVRGSLGRPGGIGQSNGAIRVPVGPHPAYHPRSGVEGAVDAELAIHREADAARNAQVRGTPADIPDNPKAQAMERMRQGIAPGDAHLDETLAELGPNKGRRKGGSLFHPDLSPGDDLVYLEARHRGLAPKDVAAVMAERRASSSAAYKAKAIQDKHLTDIGDEVE